MSEIRQRCVERSDKEDVGLNKIEEIKNEVFAEKREGEEERGDGEGEAVRSELERENEEAEGEGSEKPTAKEKHSDDEAESEDKLLVTAEDIADPVAPPAGKESKENEVLETALSGLPTRWKNWVIRGIFSWVMILSFALVIYLGPLALMCMVLVIQIACFYEIINIGYSVYKVYDLPWFRSLSWYFLITSNYFFYGENMVDYFGVVLHKDDALQFLTTYHRFISFVLYIMDALQFLTTYHRFISFVLYIMGFVGFVLSLVKTHYLRQFSLFAWTHVTLLLIVTQSHLIIQNIFHGMVWFLVPVSLIICNDIMAYMFGFFFGKTPLIKLSPKKTWEGWLGGLVSTIAFGWVLAAVLVRYDYFTCPVDFSDGHLNMTCERTSTFTSVKFQFPAVMRVFLTTLHLPASMTLFPFQLHAVGMALFASIIGPFGGFFASGFKRAFKIKDFGDLIPGHGGMMDRFDCQLLMASYVHVYHYSFVRAADPKRLLQLVLAMPPEQQLQFFNTLKDRLLGDGTLKLTAQ